MMTANQIREKFLNASNPELLSECEWALNAMVEKKKKNATFEWDFNDEDEILLFIKHIKELGYNLTLDYAGTSDGINPFRRMIILGIN